jgi:lipopolysaccharide export system permease protein
LLQAPADSDTHKVVILSRHITAEIVKPMFLGISLLVIVFTGYSFAVKLSQAANGLFPLPVVMRLIGLNSLIAMEILLPTALYLSIISTLSRFYRDSEMTAMNAAGYSEARLIRTVVKVTLFVAVLVGIVSLFARPWAYRQSYQIEADAQAEFDIRKIEPGHFIELQDAKYVLFARSVDRKRGTLHDVFLQSEKGAGARARVQVIYAREAYMPPVRFGEARNFEFRDGYSYLLDPKSSQDTTLKFKQLIIPIPGIEKDTSYRRKAASTIDLSQSDARRDVAEYQWRLSTPLATLALALLAVPLSRSAPRQGRHTSFIIAIAAYTGLFILTSAARKWVADGVIPAVPGIWWVYGLPLLLFAILTWAPLLQWRSR